MRIQEACQASPLDAAMMRVQPPKSVNPNNLEFLVIVRQVFADTTLARIFSPLGDPWRRESEAIASSSSYALAQIDAEGFYLQAYDTGSDWEPVPNQEEYVHLVAFTAIVDFFIEDYSALDFISEIADKVNAMGPWHPSRHWLGVWKPKNNSKIEIYLLYSGPGKDQGWSVDFYYQDRMLSSFKYQSLPTALLVAYQQSLTKLPLFTRLLVAIWPSLRPF